MKLSLLASVLFVLPLAAISQSSPPVAFENLGKEVNSEYSEVRPTISADGNLLYFVVEGHPSNTYSKLSNKAQDIWYSEKGADGKWGQAKQAPKVLNSQKSNAVFWVSPDGNRMLIRGAFDNGKYLGRGFSITEKTEAGWSAPQKLDIRNYEKLSMDAYSGATMANDGKTLLLYFSEEKNSFSNDIYISNLTENNTWTEPKKLDAPISTEEYNEITPFLAADGLTLYFSSDRPGGKGDHDIWMTRRIDDSWRKWTEPVNVSSVNTKKWDAYFTMDAAGEKAYIATAESSLGGTDIASVPLDESLKPKATVLVYGNVYNAKTLQPMGADLYYDIIPGEKNAGNAISDPTDGSYKIVLPYGKRNRLRASATSYFPVLDTIDLTKIGAYREIHRDIYLNPADEYVREKEIRKSIDSLNSGSGGDAGAGGAAIEEGMIVEMKNILFDYNKATLRAECYNDLDKAARLMKANPNMKVELSAHTDNIGGFSYNLKLSEERANSAREYLVSRGIAGDRIVSKGYGEVKPVSTNDTEVGRQQNRRVEFRVLNK